MSSNTAQSSGAVPARAKSNRSLLATCTIAALLPIIWLCILVQRHWVSVPLLDDWEMAPLIVKAHNGSLTFHDVFVQHEEARNIFPKLLFVLFAAGGRWDVRVEMAAGVVICCLTLFTLCLLLRQSRVSSVGMAFSVALMSLLIFSPAQHELWLLASGFYSFLPVLCIAAGLAIIQTRWSVAAKFVSCAVLAFVSSFTLAHGLLAWALTFPFLFSHVRTGRWKVWLLAWIAMCATCAALYFHGYEKPSDLPAFAPVIAPIDYVQYLLAFLGSGLTRSGNGHPLFWATMVGGLGLVLFAGAGVYLVRQYDDRELIGAAAPWVALGTYSIGSGVLAALGRIGWGVPQALESRYVAFSIYLFVALVGLTAVIGTRRNRLLAGKWRAYFFAGAATAAAALLTLHTLCSIASIASFRMRAAATRLGHAAVLFSQVIDTSEATKSVMYPRPGFLREQAAALDALHLLKPPLIRTTKVNSIRHGTADDKAVSGWLDRVVTTTPESYSAAGWAAMRSKGKPADAVVLAYTLEGGEPILFAMASTIEARADVARALGLPIESIGGWRASFLRDAVPPGAVISAWAFDVRDLKLFRLKENAGQSKL